MENKSAVALKRKLEDKVTDTDGTEKPSKAVKANHVATLAQSNDPFIEAIIDVQRASERAFAIGKDRLVSIDKRYYTGIETGQDPSVADAFALLQANTGRLGVLTDNLQSKVKRAPVNRLPNELFYAVFDLLDTDTLFTCRDVCKPWRDALTTSLVLRTDRRAKCK